MEFDLRYALPLGFWNAALNFGISAGLVLPWGKGFMSMPSPLPERFFIGGHASPVCSLGGPSMLLGFKPRGLGPTEARRLMISQSDKDETAGSPGRDVLGGDLAVTAFADLSFNLPLKLFRESGIHGHIFVSAGNLAKLTENEYQNFSLRKFADSFRSSAGLGIIVPTKVFRMEDFSIDLLVLVDLIILIFSPPCYARMALIEVDGIGRCELSTAREPFAAKICMNE
ncbi:hypothetical protein ACLOJK_023409 [Asimina triloba]